MSSPDEKTILAAQFYLVNLLNNQVIQLHDGLILGRLSIGGHLPNDGILSAEHAKFHVRTDGVQIEDLNSTNGTRVNGVQIQGGQPLALKPGDRIELGNQRLVFTDKPELLASRRPEAPGGEQRQFGRRLEDSSGDPLLASFKSFLLFRNWHSTTAGLAIIVFFEFVGMLFVEWMGWHRDVFGVPVRGLIYALIMVAALGVHNFIVRRVPGRAIQVASTIAVPLVYPGLLLITALVLQSVIPKSWKVSRPQPTPPPHEQALGAAPGATALPIATATPSPTAKPEATPAPSAKPKAKAAVKKGSKAAAAKTKKAAKAKSRAH